MKLWPTSVRAASLAAALVFAASGASAQEGDLAAARELYASASYDDALTVLNKLRSSDHPASQARAIEQYRAFCLLALGRAADAQQAIEAVVAAEPSYQPTEGDVSPRIRTAFADVRRRMLPAIIQQKYAQAKAAYDKKAPLENQAARIASLLGTDAGYVEDASFVKLREIALTLLAPNDWSKRAGMSNLSLTLAGRNLATWTDYKGFDPELNWNGSSNFSTADFLTQPPVRYFTARLSFGW